MWVWVGVRVCRVRGTVSEGHVSTLLENRLNHNTPTLCCWLLECQAGGVIIICCRNRNRPQVLDSPRP